MDEDALAFFNSLSGRLRVNISEPARAMEPLANLVAPSTAQLVSVSLSMDVFEEEKGDFRDLTEEEWSLVVLRAAQIRLRSRYGDGRVVEIPAKDGQTFTVADLRRAIEETEGASRGTSKWFDGIDVHHIFFEGIGQSEDGVWLVRWGS